MPARAYPYAAWPRVRREDARLLRGALRALPFSPSALAKVAREAQELLGAEARLVPSVAELWSTDAAKAALLPPLSALWLEQVAGARALPLLCELSPALAAVLVDRGLGGDGRAAHPVGDVLDDLSAGALCYLFARLCAAAGADLRVRALLSDPAQARELLAADGALVLPIALELAGERVGFVRVFLPEASARELGLRPRPVSAPPAALRTLPVALCAHAASVTLRRDELLALRAGDVVIPQRCRLVREPDGWRGALRLHVVGSLRTGFRCSTRHDELIVEALDTPEDPCMTETKSITTKAPLDTTATLAGDAPISLCLELARFTLSLEELSQLTAGEVLSTGRPIGETATLCAAGKPIARGELVDIEGAIGLRVLELLR
jgi:type III secretion system YscQ/HrcQ family protein